jgi:hypothetical protein
VPELRLGKLPAKRDKRDLLFANYVQPVALPKPPPQFGHETLFGPRAWGMLGNDEWGDCAWAGPAHETMLLTKEGKRAVQFTTEGVLSDYSACTGFNPSAGPPGRNKTDKGTAVRAMMSYRRESGIVDSTGKRHKIGAYLALDETNLQEIYLAIYLFQAVGIGFNFPESAFAQFDAGKPWDVVPNSPIKGGHYVCGIGKRRNLEVITWGALQQMTPRFFRRYCDEAWTYVSNENLRGGHNLEGFDLAQLKADLKALQAAQV